jgi:hypothetical protein
LRDTTLAANRDFFLSPFSEISPQCNIPNGNQRDESLALVYFPYRNPSEGKHLGKICFNFSDTDAAQSMGYFPEGSLQESSKKKNMVQK